MTGVLRILIVGLFLASSVGAGAFAIALFLRKRAWLRNCDRVTGTVIAFKEVRHSHRSAGDPVAWYRYRAESGGTTYRPVVQYRTKDGETVTFENSYGQSHGNVTVSDSIDVLVNRSDPKEAMIAGFLPQWFVSLALLFIAVSSLVAAIAVYFIIQ